MVEYLENNLNPKRRKTGDCSTRALCGVTNIGYNEILLEQVNFALKTYYDTTSKQVIEKVLAKYGFVKMKQPRKWDNTKYTVGELDEILTEKQMEQGVVVLVAHHWTCIVNGKVQDIWDCRNKTVGNYYIKQGEKYFDSIDKAKEWIKENKIEKYEFHTPEFLERGVEIKFESNLK